MSTENTAAAVPGPAAALAILAVVVVIIVAWIALALQFITDKSLFGGFLMLWYWANNGGLEIKNLPAAILGGVVGIALAWFLVYGAQTWGAVGMGASLVALLAALFLDIRKSLPLLINGSTMLYLTVAAAPLIQLQVDWTQLVLSTVVGGVFFGLVVEGLKRLAARFAPAA